MTASPQRPKVLLIGAGSVGAVYLYQLLHAGCEVTAICRSNYTRVKDYGFQLKSLRYGNVSYKPTQTLRSTAECDGRQYDYVLVCTKSMPDAKPSLVDILKPVVTDRAHTVIVLAQNGIQIEDEVALAFPENPLISGVIYLPAVQVEPGVVEYPEMLNLLELGTYPANAPDHHKVAVEQFATLMIEGGGAAMVHDNIQVPRWNKLMFNCAWNPICALTLCSDGDFLLSSQLADTVAWKVMMEVLALAERLGVEGVTVEIATEKIEIARRRARDRTGREPSMLQDVRNGRQLEVEAMIGNTIRLGQKHGVPMPRLETLYVLLKGLDRAMSSS